MVGWLASLTCVWGMALQWDDPLDPAIASFIAPVMRDDAALLSGLATEGGQAYAYLLGIGTDAQRDPLAAGRDWLLAPQRQVIQQALPKTLALSDDLPLCDFIQDDCPAPLLAVRDVLAPQLTDHATLLTRYRHVIRAPAVTPLFSPRIDAPTPQYAYLIQANRVQLTQWWYSVSPAHTKETQQTKQTQPSTPALTSVVDLVMTNMQHIRHRLAQEDSLIGKMVYLTMFEEHLAWLRQVAAQHETLPAVWITQLTPRERSLTLSVAREFAMIHQFNLSLSGRSDLFSPTELIPQWAARMAYKPHITSNTHYRYYAHFARLSELSEADYIAQYQHWPVFEMGPVRRVRNLAGAVLSDIAIPDYRQYIERFHAVNRQITQWGDRQAQREMHAAQ
ncbi:hypothetical protein L4C36_16270 [Photobacterium japonica]|uniref:hypothetical protein n=1 Tax=Photobacterium japonica TaxID=2910235 RepID=UPI003D0BFDC5